MQFRGGGGDNFEGPRDIWRELAEADLRTLGRRTFRVYGPTAPLLDAPTLASWERHNDKLVTIVLSHGSPFDADGPYVSVQTLAEEADHRQRSLRDVIEDERDRLFQHAGIDDGEAPVLAVESEPWLTIDGIPVRAALRGEGRLWAARLSVGGPDCPLRNRGGDPVTLTVTGRGIAPERIALRTVEDLQPYAEGRQVTLNAMGERRRARAAERGEHQAGRRPEPAGLDAHRRLVDFSVQQALRIEAALRSGHDPREPRSGRADRGDLWESAVQQQMRLAGEDRDAANEAVTALVNQMVRLAERAAWFPGTEDGRAAVEESIRYTVFDSEVPSVAAQRAWRRDWARGSDSWPVDQPAAAEPERLRSEWLDNWQSWRMERAAASG